MQIRDDSVSHHWKLQQSESFIGSSRKQESKSVCLYSDIDIHIHSDMKIENYCKSVSYFCHMASWENSVLAAAAVGFNEIIFSFN